MEAFLEEEHRRNDPNSLENGNDRYGMSALTDKTILNIYKTAKLRNKLRIAESNKRLAKLFEIYCAKRYKILDLKILKQLPPKHISSLLNKMGKLVRTLQGTINYREREDFIQYIVNNTINIKTLRLWHSELKVDNLHHLFLNNNSVIQHLSLVNCNLNDYSIIPILQLRSLKSLSIAHNKGITGKYLCKLRGLHLLDVSGCVFFEAEKLLEILHAYYYLRILNIQDCPCVDKLLIKNLSKHALALDKLIITGNTREIYKYLTMLPTVRNFEIKCIESPGVNFFKQLVKKKRYELEGLIMKHNSCISTEILNIMSSFENLREIYLGSRCIYEEYGLMPFRKLVHLEKIVIKNCICLDNNEVLYLIKHCTQLKDLRIIRCPKISTIFFEKIVEKAEGRCKYQMYKCPCGETVSFVRLNQYGSKSKYIYINCECDVFPIDDDLAKMSNILN